MITTAQLDQQQARALLQSCFADMIGEAQARGGFVPETAEPEFETAEQIALSKEVQGDLQEQVTSATFGRSVQSQARASLRLRGADLGALGFVSQLNVLSGIARAMIERERLFQLRALDRLGPYVPVDAFFAVMDPNPAASGSIAPSTGPSIADAVASYLKHGKNQWRPKTLAARKVQLGFFVEHLGPALPLEQVTVDHVRAYRDALRRLHRRHGKMVGATFAAKQTPNKAHQISDAAALINFAPVKVFFRWASTIEGLVNTSPADGVRIIVAKKSKSHKVRRPFSEDELEQLFSSPNFTGCASKHRRTARGDLIIKDGKFWLPILGLYTGARLGELVQLHVGDVNTNGAIPYLSINEENGSSDGGADRKHVKSKAGIRLVPLHPDVMQLGFADFVAKRSLAKGCSRVRLFAEFPFGKDGQASTVASKWFGRFMDSVGLTDRLLCFHSLRHNAEDAFREARQPQYVIDKIIGHSDGATSSLYGEGVSLQIRHEAITEMRLKVRLPDILKG